MSQKLPPLILSDDEIKELQQQYKQEMVRAHIEPTQVELKHLPSYSPNLNLIERLWRFLKGKVMSDYHPSFADFVAEIDNVLDNLDAYADELASLMTEKFEILACA